MHNVADALTKSLLVPGPAWSLHQPCLTGRRTEYTAFFLSLGITEPTAVACAEAGSCHVRSSRGVTCAGEPQLPDPGCSARMCHWQGVLIEHDPHRGRAKSCGLSSVTWVTDWHSGVQPVTGTCGEYRF
eukprot:1537468-Rhodomonas_salina.1